MGEIVFSVAIGGCLAIAGILMVLVLGNEEKKVRENEGMAYEYFLCRSGCQHISIYSSRNLGRTFDQGCQRLLCMRKKCTNGSDRWNVICIDALLW